jgi:hypothetical protein
LATRTHVRSMSTLGWVLVIVLLLLLFGVIGISVR